MKIGILTTHPIQYYAPWFKYLASLCDLNVYYAFKQNAEGQAQAGFSVSFEWDIPLLEGYAYYFLKNVASNPSLQRFNGCDTPEIYEIIRKENFDAFLILGWNKKSMVQAAWACKKYKVPILSRGDSHLLTPRSIWLKYLKYFPYRWFLNQIDAHLYVGQLNKAYLQHYGVKEANLYFCPHFINNNYFSQQGKLMEETGQVVQLKEQLGIKKTTKVVLFVGKFIPKKRPKDIIKAINKVSTTYPKKDIRLVLVGDGPLRVQLEQFTNGSSARIHFAGFKNQSELPVYYKIADLLVLASDGGETWGLVGNEAMSAGCPIIVSDQVGCGYDLVDTGSTGFSYQMGNIEELAVSIMQLLALIDTDKEKLQVSLQQKIQQYSMEKASYGLFQAVQQVKYQYA